MYAERDTFGPASLSMLATRSSDKVSDVFDFILHLYYQSSMSARYCRSLATSGNVSSVADIGSSCYGYM